MMLDESANMWLMIAEHVAPDLKVDYCKAAHMIPSLPPLFSSPPLLCRVMTAKCSIHVIGVGGMYKCKRPVMTKHKIVVAIVTKHDVVWHRRHWQRHVDPSPYFSSSATA